MSGTKGCPALGTNIGKKKKNPTKYNSNMFLSKMSNDYTFISKDFLAFQKILVNLHSAYVDNK